VSADQHTAPGRMLRLAALPTAPSLARAFVIHTTRDWPVSAGCRESMRLLASELITNAVRHTGRVDGPPTPLPTETVIVVGVQIRLLGPVVRLEVWDSDPAPAIRADPSPEAETGRGLVLVEALSQAWGSYTPRIGGKVVWCDVGQEGMAESTESASPAPVSLPRRTRKAPKPGPSSGPAQTVADVAMLERVLLGLRRVKPEQT
jgi:anti-sigma regulatory factor (Ser/Thr protein kinase)